MPFVIDCGGGTVQRLALARAANQPTLAWHNLKTLILTHLHPDHTAGLADFIISTWVNGRKEPLVIYGPKGTKKMTDLLVEAYELGIAEHRDTESPTNWPLHYEVIEFSAGEVIKTDDVKVTAFEVVHGGLETYGLKFETAEKIIVFSSDTCPHPDVIKYSTDCDVLVHEVYSENGLINNPRPNMPLNYFRRMHTSTIDQLHLSNSISDEEMLQEITDLYEGEVIFGRDLDVFQV